jgi:hypothetical protein
VGRKGNVATKDAFPFVVKIRAIYTKPTGSFIIEGSWHLPYRVDTVLGRVHGLAIQVLNAALGLLHLASGPCTGVAGKVP